MPTELEQAQSAAAQLRWHYENRFAAARNQPDPIVGCTSHTVPWELLRAAALFPVILSPPAGETPFADPYMESVFDPRIRMIFDRLLSGEWWFLKLVVIPRTSEQEHKLFLYLREVARQESSARLPEIYLYNLLQTRSDESHAYGLDRTRELATLLNADQDILHKAIEEGNAARQAIRQLLQLRGDRLTGAEALPLIGAFYFMGRGEYAKLASEALPELSRRTPRQPLPRLLIKGVPLDQVHLHRAVEAPGAVVVAEDDWWGSRAPGDDILTEGDPLAALFEKYYRSPGPRVFPPEAADQWFYTNASAVDGVIFYLPPEDDVWGWDYPRHRNWLQGRGIPHLLIRDRADQLSPHCLERIAAFVEGLGRSRHG